jgi:hypothetical protein
MTSFNSDEIQRLLTRDEDELWAVLGSAVDKSMHALPPSKKALAARAKTWFEEHVNELQQKVCPSPVAQRLMSGDTADEVSIVATLAGTLSSSFHPVIALAVSVLVVKRGLAAFCRGWSEK